MSGQVTVNVYGDVTSQVGTVIASLTATTQGIVSNTVASNSASGQTVTVSAGLFTTANVAFATSSAPVGQLVIAGSSNFNGAIFNFNSTTTNVTIQELKFTIGDNQSGKTVSNVTVNGVSAIPVGGVADISGLNVLVQGNNVPVSVNVVPTYAPVNYTNMFSGATSTIALTYVKASVGGTVVQLYPNISGNQMTLVSTKPTVTLVGASSKLQGGFNTLELGDITVSADAGGPLYVTGLPIAVSNNGYSALALSSIANGKLTVSDTISGGTFTSSQVSGSLAALATSTPGTSTTTLAFTGTGIEIPAGQSDTFRISASVEYNGTSLGQGDANIGLGLGTGQLFTWTDITGNANLTGSALLTPSQYPSSGSTVQITN